MSRLSPCTVAAGVLLWVWPPLGNAGVALEVVLNKGGLLVWAVDEFFRGVNPWRCSRYELATIF
jgi:hypothetical protein